MLHVCCNGVQVADFNVSQASRLLRSVWARLVCGRTEDDRRRGAGFDVPSSGFRVGALPCGLRHRLEAYATLGSASSARYGRTSKVEHASRLCWSASLRSHVPVDVLKRKYSKAQVPHSVYTFHLYRRQVNKQAVRTRIRCEYEMRNYVWAMVLLRSPVEVAAGL
jgi:hypothetical protein